MLTKIKNIKAEYRRIRITKGQLNRKHRRRHSIPKHNRLNTRSYRIQCSFGAELFLAILGPEPEYCDLYMTQILKSIISYVYKTVYPY